MTAQSIKEQHKLNCYNKREKLSLPKYSLGEEIFSAVTHGVSAIAAVVGLTLLLVFCRKDPITVTSCAIFGGSMILLYTVSTIYHALGLNKAKKIFRTLDHCTIFLLIAATYTPVTLTIMGGTKGFVIFGIVWAMALLGIVLNAISVKKYAKFSMFCYIAMGWLIIFVIKDFVQSAGMKVVVFFLIGGIVYTVGAVLYGLGKKVPYIHSVWHIFVFVGSFFHYLGIFDVVTR